MRVHFLQALVLVVAATLSAQPTSQTLPKSSVVPSQKTIREAQQRLQLLGYEPGTADGVMGSKTVLAVKKFQADHGLAVTGTFDPKTLQAISTTPLLASDSNTGPTRASSTRSAPVVIQEKPTPPKPQATFSEAALTTYRKGASGGFSPYWVAYILHPEKGAADQATFVELNGRSLGPYDRVSEMMELSRGGKHMAFAAEKKGKWVVVVDGVEKYTHDGFLWPSFTWTSNLEGNRVANEVQAVDLEFSPTGDAIAYPAKTSDGKYAVFVNGKQGPSYPDVGSSVIFVDGQVKYFAFAEDKKIVEIHGTRVLGPYDTAYKAKISSDAKHYVFWAKKAGTNVLVFDDQEREIPGEISDYLIGNSGFLAYAYQSSGKYHVHVGNTDLPAEYDEVREMTISPDGTKVAYWARSGAEWTVWAGDHTLPGFDGYYYYQSGGTKYSLMWSPDSQHVAYYVRGKQELVLDGQSLGKGFTPPGMALQVIVDERRTAVGSGLMQGPHVESTAVVQAVLMRDKTKCETFSVALSGKELSCVEKKDATTAYMHLGDKTEGPFRSILSTLLTSTDEKHYAYAVETDKGQQFVIDGSVSSHAYEAIYRPVFNEENKSLDYLAVKEGNLIRVVEPLPAR
jgi:hypothetical protein